MIIITRTLKMYRIVYVNYHFFTKMTMKNIIIGILGARLDHAGLAAGMLATWYLVIDAREFSGG